MNAEQWKRMMDSLAEQLPGYGLAAAAALVILLVGWVLSRWAGQLAFSAASRLPRNAALAGFVRRVVRVIVMVLTIIAALNQVGVPMTSFLAVLGAAGLAIGLALKDTLSDLAAGIILLVLRPFDVGDAVRVDGVEGTVLDVGLFATKIDTFDGIRVMLRNSRVWGEQIHNLVVTGRRRLEVRVGVEYVADIGEVRRVLTQAMEQEPRILAEPAPVVLVDRLADSSIELVVRYWVKTADVIEMRSETTRLVRRTLNEAGVSIPFPQREIRVISGSAVA
jgi:small conductance mechanosensitive channel